ncbi:DUF7426 family protein [Amycolatopsis thermophila]|uniref:DUF7426 domain-containing protein n=1 Tax=Amycolatopsis thermophila TaxID=206084 RepID=A0ABU0ESP5_9PSEU|nr:hypothetical protein [Amycolatopsis thermophila]MDQ0377965.1 hypothetical protein [Amycolatopsis thermophila]
MTTFPQLDHFEADTNGQTARLTIRGTTFTFARASVPMERGIQLMRLNAEYRRAAKARREGLSYTLKDVPYEGESGDDSTIDAYLDLIGDQRPVLAAAGFSFDDMLHVGEVLFAWFTTGPAGAQRLFDLYFGEATGRPPADASASSSPPTTSPTSSSRKKPASSRAAASRGRKSSPSGTSSKRKSTSTTE